jgi:hypothetical protein
MLIVSFIIIIDFKKAEISFKEKFGSINCNAIHESYSESEITRFAAIEYLDQKDKGKMPLNGFSQCFCEKER